MLYKNHLDIPVFQLAHQTALVVYKTTKSFPKEELYGIVLQLRRAVSSIPANIVEGFYRGSKKELVQFLTIARGSCGESRYLVLLAKDLGYITRVQFDELDGLLVEIHKQLNGWIRMLRSSIH